MVKCMLQRNGCVKVIQPRRIYNFLYACDQVIYWLKPFQDILDHN